MNFKQAIENSTVTDLKMELRNLNYEQLLELAVGQKLLIKDYEQDRENTLIDIITQKEIAKSLEIYTTETEILDRDFIKTFAKELQTIL